LGCTSTSPPRRKMVSERSSTMWPYTTGQKSLPAKTSTQSPQLGTRSGKGTQRSKTRGVGMARDKVAVFRSIPKVHGATTDMWASSTAPSPSARLRGEVYNTNEHPTPPGPTRPSPHEAAAPNDEDLRWGGKTASSSPPLSLAPRRFLACASDGGLREKRGRSWVAKFSSPP
jgi:hypothetical protein